MRDDVKHVALTRAEARSSKTARAAGRVRSISKRAWAAGLRALSGGTSGIDDSAFPSGYMAPHRRGSRGVRNLWHQPF